MATTATRPHNTSNVTRRLLRWSTQPPYGAANLFSVPPADTSADSTEPGNIKPLDVDGVNVVITGTVLFAIGFVVLLFFRSNLQANGQTWWLWVCATGFGLGLVGTAYVTRRRAAYRAAAARSE